MIFKQTTRFVGTWLPFFNFENLAYYLLRIINYVNYIKKIFYMLIFFEQELHYIVRYIYRIIQYIEFVTIFENYEMKFSFKKY